MERKFEEQYLLRKNDQIYDQNTVQGRENRLYEASMNGNVNSLKQLMEEDPLALARASVTCFNETLLHIAAMLGHVDFAKAILNHKPDMAMAIDFQGRSPLHLAAANGYNQIVNILLLCHPNACIIRDEDGRMPLHLAVMKGQVEVIRELVTAWPEAAGPALWRGGPKRHSKRGPIVYTFFFTCNINIKPKTLVFIMLKPKIILQQSIHKEGF